MDTASALICFENLTFPPCGCRAQLSYPCAEWTGMNGFDLQEAVNKAADEGWTVFSISSYSEGMPLAVLKKEKK